VQDDIQKMLPLVDRAEKNANTVIAQQKILTQVGQALRAINRQSSDLLETDRGPSLRSSCSKSLACLFCCSSDVDAAHR